MSLQLYEIITCKPCRFGMHEYEVSRRVAGKVLRVSGILARNGKAAVEIAHLVFDKRSDMLAVKVES
jgi:hypothetical protein